MKRIRLLFAVFLLATSTLHAQLVADGATNTLANVTNSITGNVIVGTNGSFTLLVLSNNCLVTNTLSGFIGLNAAAKSNEVRLVSPTAQWQVGGTLLVGNTGSWNNLVINGGAAVSSFDAGIGRRATSTNNRAIVSGAGSSLRTTDFLVVGVAGGSNSLEISSGGFVGSGFGSLGSSGSGNEALVSGAGSVWSNVADLFIGELGGNNRLTVSDAGRLIGNNGFLGSGSSATNNQVVITGSGSVWSNRANLTVGSSGNQLIVSNGASVFVDRDAVLGVSGASANAATITGAGTRWLIATNLFVGSNGPLNRLTISDGALVTNRVSTIGQSLAAVTNEVLVADPGTTWNSSSQLGLGFNGSGNRLTISNGAVVSSFLGFVGQSLPGSNNSATITGPGSVWTNHANFVLGVNSPFNRLLVANGARLHSTNGVVGSADTATNNEAIISGAGSAWNNVRDLTIGQLARSNRVTIENGGTLSAAETVLGRSITSSNNLALVYGGGSLMSNLNDVTIGQVSPGNRLVVSNGAAVHGGGNGLLGVNSGANANSVWLSDTGTSWLVNSDLYVGSNGAFNVLVVSNGARLTDQDGFLGRETPSSNNLAIVTGAGSAWTNVDSLFLGAFGSANRLVINNGGRVRNIAGIIGLESSANNNEAVVTDPGSLWANGGISVGSLGNRNRLVVSNAATVTVNVAVTIGDQSSATNNRVIVDGGTLRATNITGNGRLEVRRGTNVLNSGLIQVDRLVLTNTLGHFEFNGGTLMTRGGVISNGLSFIVGRGSSTTPALWDVRAGLTDTFVGSDFLIGSNSSFNQLILTNGAQLTNTGIGWLGYNFGANSNSATLAGAGSQWFSQSGVLVGVFGASSRLVVSNGGSLVTGGYSPIGHELISTNNEVVVTGPGSSWTSDLGVSIVGVAVGGTGHDNRLLVSDGGRVVNKVGVVGLYAGSSNNLALVTGVGSLWSNATELHLGNTGAGNSLVVSNGGTAFTAGAVYLGFLPASTNNRLTVDGGTFRATNASATGLLEIRRGTSVLNGGLIEADILRMTNGISSKLELNSGTLAIRSSRVSIGPPVMVGDGTNSATLLLAGNGTHDFTGTLGLIVTNNATLTGNGSLLAQVQIRSGAVLSPGTSVGSISLNPPPFLSGTTLMELSKNGATLTNDQIQVTGTVTYGGALTVTHLGPTPLAAGDKFKLFNASAYAGSFTSMTLPPLAPGWVWVNNLLVDGSIEVFAPPPVGAGFALSFDGTNDFVGVTHHSALNAFPLVATLWIKTTQATGEVGLVNKYLAGSLNGWHVGLLNGEVRAWYLRDNANRVGNEGAGLNGGPVNDGAWHHVAFTVDAGGGHLYVDGFLRDEMDWTGTSGNCTTTQALNFGRYPGGSGEFYRGELEEAAIWGSVTPTQSEIKSNLDRGLIGSELGLVSHHRFNEGTGFTAENTARSTGTATAGFLQNGVTWVPGLILRPAVLTRVATAVGVNSAKLHGESNPGLADTRAWFEWGTTTAYGNVTPLQFLGSGGSNTNISQSITGLTENVTYHFRAAASNSVGVSFGADKSFVATGTNMLSPRVNHTATLLPNGKVLVTGGQGQNFNALATAELFDPVSGKWAPTAPMSIERSDHTAILLPNGKVLVAGGQGPFFTTPHATAELYDPITETWTPTASMGAIRNSHTATLLSDGKVLVAGGSRGNLGFDPIAELYDPATETWTETGALLTWRVHHTATLLPDGKVLLAGGLGTNSAILSGAELYDPVSGTWTNTGSMTTNRSSFTATLLRNGKVIVAGGNSGTTFLRAAELYDPNAGTWSATGAMLNSRFDHTATLLPDGRVLVAGNGVGGPSVYNPLAGTWTDVSGPDPNSGATATLLLNGSVLVAGGTGNIFTDLDPTAAAEVFVPQNPSWSLTPPMVNVRGGHTATLLSNALVLVASFGNAELYNPSTGSWTNTGALISGRSNHTATLLPNGQVLAVGGQNSFFASLLASAELYSPWLGTWTNTGSLSSNRASHTATLLDNGKVLVTGGFADSFATPYQTAELYDPAIGSWTNAGAMTTNRNQHSATLLPNGKVLVVGGVVGNAFSPIVTSTAELYDPASGAWTAVAPMTADRCSHIAVLLPNGKVLVAGGTPSLDVLAVVHLSAELFDPATGTWQATGSMTSRRRNARATLLPNGKVLVTGGRGPSNQSSAEIYDPATGQWTATLFMSSSRTLHTSTLLPNSKVLIAGGYFGSGGNATNSAELYDIGLLASNVWKPQILTASLNAGGSLAITGTQFRGLSTGSGGNGAQDSPTDFPIVQLRRLENEQSRVILPTGWSASSFASVSVPDFQPGWAMATVYVSGIPSDSKLLFITAATPTAFQLAGMSIGLNGHFQFSFTNAPGAPFTVLATTNVSLPVSNWTVLTNATEVAPGQYQFSDPQTTNHPQRYYRVRSP